MENNSPTTILNRHSSQNIPRRSAAKVPKHHECGERIRSLPSGESHERPFGRSKREAEERHESLQEHSGALGAHTHVHAKFILRADVQGFGRELDGGSEGVYRNAEIEMRLRSNGVGAGRGIEDGESCCDRHAYISWKK